MARCNYYGDYHHDSPAEIQQKLKIKKIANQLGINAGMLSFHTASRNCVISTALRRAHENPLLWAHLMAIYQSIDSSNEINKLVKTGNSGSIDELIHIVNSCHSSSAGEHFVDALIKEQEKHQKRINLGFA